MRKVFSVIAFSLCLVLCGCAAREYEKNIFAMDTVMDLKIYSNGSDALSKSEEEIRRIDGLFDRGDENSEIYKINKDKTAVVSDETLYVIRSALALSERTGGAFDITTAPVTDLWGFYGGNFRVPSQNEIQNALEGVGYEKIKLDGNTVIMPENTAADLGGIGKGYASDRVADILKENGVKSAIISLGGNVYTLGSRPNGRKWSVGITDPADKSQLAGKVNVNNMAVVTSGGYQRYFESGGKTYHHIIDPKTGESAQSGLSSVTIISPSGIGADALSTALFVAGLEKGTEIWRKSDDFEAVFIDGSGVIYVTEGIADSFESDRDFCVLRR